MKCWKCGAEVIDPPKRVPFRMTCESCAAWLHACKGCANYQPGLPNDCRVPDTDPIRDREASNFCEFFELGGERREGASVEDVSRRLFGDDDLPESKSFDDLFK